MNCILYWWQGVIVDIKDEVFYAKVYDHMEDQYGELEHSINDIEHGVISNLELGQVFNLYILENKEGESTIKFIFLMCKYSKSEYGKITNKVQMITEI